MLAGCRVFCRQGKGHIVCYSDAMQWAQNLLAVFCLGLALCLFFFSAFIIFKLGTPLVEGYSATVHAINRQPAFFDGKQVEHRYAAKDQQ